MYRRIAAWKQSKGDERYYTFVHSVTSHCCTIRKRAHSGYLLHLAVSLALIINSLCYLFLHLLVRGVKLLNRVYRVTTRVLHSAPPIYVFQMRTTNHRALTCQVIFDYEIAPSSIRANRLAILTRM